MIFDEVILGPMFAGKTARLIRLAKHIQSRGQSLLVVRVLPNTPKPLPDELVSREQTRIACMRVAPEHLAGYLRGVSPTPGCILLDEMHFASMAQLLEIPKAHYILAGLAHDFHGTPYVAMWEWAKHADRVSMLLAECSLCENAATRSYRRTAEDTAVVLDTGKNYEPRCVRCFYRDAP